MSGLYNAVFGDGSEMQRGALLLGLLEQPHIGRFRDAWVERGEDGEPVIAIYTRNGGGYREHVETCTPEARVEVVHCIGCLMETIRDHPLYLRDADDTFDGTYTTVYFRLPDGLDPDVRAALRANAIDPVDMSEVWRAAIDRLGTSGGGGPDYHRRKEGT